ncbi:hypothetical protein BG004_001617 [Podila humilis]|nr:hypothetical protein BG004_001617 [Podila humilis]
MSNDDLVVRNAIQQVGVNASIQWIRQCIEFHRTLPKKEQRPLQSSTTTTTTAVTSATTTKDITNFVYQMYLLADFRTLQQPNPIVPYTISTPHKQKLFRDSTSVGSSGGQKRAEEETGGVILQILQIWDISNSSLKILEHCEALGVQGDQNGGFQVGRALPRGGMYTLELTDGLRKMKAVTIQPIPDIALEMKLGAKIRVKEVDVRHGVLQLYPNNTIFLGGEVASMNVHPRRLVIMNQMRAKLGYPLDPYPTTGATAATTMSNTSISATTRSAEPTTFSNHPPIVTTWTNTRPAITAQDAVPSTTNVNTTNFGIATSSAARTRSESPDYEAMFYAEQQNEQQQQQAQSKSHQTSGTGNGGGGWNYDPAMDMDFDIYMGEDDMDVDMIHRDANTREPADEKQQLTRSGTTTMSTSTAKTKMRPPVDNDPLDDDFGMVGDWEVLSQLSVDDSKNKAPFASSPPRRNSITQTAGHVEDEWADWATGRSTVKREGSPPLVATLSPAKRGLAKRFPVLSARGRESSPKGNATLSEWLVSKLPSSSFSAPKLVSAPLSPREPTHNVTIKQENSERTESSTAPRKKRRQQQYQASESEEENKDFDDDTKYGEFSNRKRSILDDLNKKYTFEEDTDLLQEKSRLMSHSKERQVSVGRKPLERMPLRQESDNTKYDIGGSDGGGLVRVKSEPGIKRSEDSSDNTTTTTDLKRIKLEGTGRNEQQRSFETEKRSGTPNSGSSVHAAIDLSTDDEEEEEKEQKEQGQEKDDDGGDIGLLDNMIPYEPELEPPSPAVALVPAATTWTRDDTEFKDLLRNVKPEPGTLPRSTPLISSTVSGHLKTAASTSAAAAASAVVVVKEEEEEKEVVGMVTVKNEEVMLEFDMEDEDDFGGLMELTQVIPLVPLDKVKTEVESGREVRTRGKIARLGKFSLTTLAVSIPVYLQPLEPSDSLWITPDGRGGSQDDTANDSGSRSNSSNNSSSSTQGLVETILDQAAIEILMECTAVQFRELVRVNEPRAKQLVQNFRMRLQDVDTIECRLFGLRVGVPVMRELDILSKKPPRKNP